MSHQIVWTDAQDMQIRRRRIEGANWETIAAELLVSLEAVTERGRRVGAMRLLDSSVPAGDPLREPLPAGHPASWDAINAGTILRGVPYPLPFFRR